MSVTDPRRREIFVNVPAVRGQTEQSFEEARIQDYVKAYTATGRPPQPCPEHPTDPAERVRLGLPPIFEPYIEVGGTPVSQSQGSSTTNLHINTSIAGPPPTDINALPEVQRFVPTSDASESGQQVQLQSIACQHVFSGFSFEELRCQAYKVGKLIVPEAYTTNTAASTPQPSMNGNAEQLQSITGNPVYAGHSFEVG
ncbi:hypothetical protein PHLCEN_2v12586 [Hermanssonia centrifuga]|uniref:Uncharacterized protein n=1 Tax=Hermanssonia centrifuga TaxID=98765 RepID=A0A2R6NGL8_9APHY|nr:hypothetical protein PHLCEN_2v12586 [Hermanssonia centrifuga]